MADLPFDDTESREISDPGVSIEIEEEEQFALNDLGEEDASN